MTSLTERTQGQPACGMTAVLILKEVLCCVYFMSLNALQINLVFVSCNCICVGTDSQTAYVHSF